MTNAASLLPQPKRRTLVLSFRAITPLYLHGADPKKVSKQEASVRGALHRWLWILLGGLEDGHGNRLDTKAVAQAEASIFGTTTWSSDLSIHMSKPQEGPAVAVERDRFLYVEWPMMPMMVNGAQAWEPGTTFTVTIDTGPMVANMSPSNEDLALAACCWCWATLGWLGARGRRGFGALHLTTIEGTLADAFAELCDEPDAVTVWCPPEKLDDWPAFLSRGLNGALKAVAALAKVAAVPAVINTAAAPPPVAAPSPEWSALASGYWRLLVVEYAKAADGQPAWADALAELSRCLRKVRERPDGKTRDLNPIQDGLAKPVGGIQWIDLRDDEFGLPRPYQIAGQRLAVEPARGIHRRPSPVVARPIAYGPDGKDVAVAWLALRATFLPNGTGSRVTGQAVKREARIAVTPPLAGLPTIRDFMVWLDSDPTGTTKADLTS